MPVSYETAVSNLFSLGPELAIHRKFDLAHIHKLAEALGNPQRKLQCVLVAGTNGKGSTSAVLAGIAQAAKYRTGLYTSPHLLRPNERIQIDREPISDAEFAEIYDRVESAAQDLLAKNLLPWHPSFFEMLTAMMFEYFASVGVDLAVLEVGMGGRLDATNICDPCISVITDIDFDHQQYLGNTLTEIAGEKAGIIRPNGLVVLLPQHPQVNDALGAAILERNAKAVSAVPYMPPVTPGADSYVSYDSHDSSVGHARHTRYPLAFMGKTIQVESPLLGRHQLRNLALSVAAAEQLNHFGFKISPEHVEEGIRNTSWRGRFQVLPATGEFPETVLDVAHNPAGAWALRSALSTYFSDRPLIVVFGAMRDKAIGEIAEILFPMADLVIATRADSPRAATASQIAEAAEPTGTETLEAENVPMALQLAKARAGSGGVVVITGSIYIVGEALKILRPSMSHQDA
ncbi:MAG TPA: folylpolyglutamate synthase/dihydrofolate synthase family protein [Candidatus Angelobacter sp.]|nr:folylpolyglutamate synthase/dihydrofolate synthase family protein [Candidatus Angelobacter sp.]